MVTRLLKSFLADEKGATAVEYGLLAALISVGLLTGLSALSGNLENTLTLISNHVKPKD